MTAELTTRPDRSPMALIEAAIEKGLLPDQLGKLMDLQERWERNRAAEKFAGAITSFQQDCPIIHKSKAGGKTKTGDTAYFYAPYDEIMRVVGPIMVRHGIVATFTTEEIPTGLRITCRIRVGIHSEATDFSLPIPTGNSLVNATQLMAQALSYAKRYSLSAALNIVTTDEDNDAGGMLDTLIAEEVKDLESAMEAKNMPLAAFLKFAQAETIESIPRKEFGRLLAAIKNSRKKEVTPA